MHSIRYGSTGLKLINFLIRNNYSQIFTQFFMDRNIKSIKILKSIYFIYSQFLKKNYFPLLTAIFNYTAIYCNEESFILGMNLV